jgi:branched-chain amino acid aminotransferase
LLRTLIVYHNQRNYAAAVKITRDAEKNGYHSVLWLSAGKITEIGTSNFFYFLKEKNGELTLVTPPDDGLILPGIMRDSVIVIFNASH